METLWEKRMVYRLFGDAVMIFHFLWILFILFGLLIGMKYAQPIWVHLAGLVFTLVLNIGVLSPIWKIISTTSTTPSSLMLDLLLSNSYRN